MTAERQPTRNDVARLAGVSSAVVSYVTNGGPRPVAASTRERVLDAIATLNYTPNEIARSLRGQRTRTVGLIAPTLLNPVWAGVSMGISDVVGEQSHLLVVCDVEDDPDQDAEYAHMLVSKRVDGVILVPTAETDATLAVLREGGVPVVVVERHVGDTPSVVVDAVETGRTVTQHLLDLGHRRIAVLREHRSALDSWMRFVGYEQALVDAGLGVDNDLVADATPSAHGSVVDGSIAAAEKLLDVEPPPTAVFAHNDLMAIAVLHVARARGLDVPSDLSIVSVDDIEAGRYVDPPLTTMPFPQRELGRAAAQRLMELLEQQPGPMLTTLSTGGLIVRGSTTVAPTP